MARGPYRRHSPQFKLQLCQDIRAGAIGRKEARCSSSANGSWARCEPKACRRRRSSAPMRRRRSDSSPDAQGVPTYSFYGERGADRCLDAASPLPGEVRALQLGSYATVVEPIASALRKLASANAGAA